MNMVESRREDTKEENSSGESTEHREEGRIL